MLLNPDRLVERFERTPDSIRGIERLERTERLTLKLQITGIENHRRGKIFKLSADGKAVTLLFTFHALERMKIWRLSERHVIRSLLEPEAVL